MSRFLLQLPHLTATDTFAPCEGNFSRQPPAPSYWYHDGEVIQVLYGGPEGLTLLRGIGVRSVVKEHPAAFWEEVEVYEP